MTIFKWLLRNNVASLAVLSIAASVFAPRAFGDLVSDRLQQLGWEATGQVQIKASSGAVGGQVFKKRVQTVYGPVTTGVVYAATIQRCLFGGGTSNLIMWNGSLIAVEWQSPATLVYSDASISTDDGEIQHTLEEQDKLISADPHSFLKLRHYKGVFGLKGNRDDMIVRGLSKIEIVEKNLVLTLANAEGEATLELAPGFEYVGSTVGGKAVPPNTVEPKPVKTRSEMLLKAAASGPAETIPAAGVPTEFSGKPRSGGIGEANPPSARPPTLTQVPTAAPLGSTAPTTPVVKTPPVTAEQRAPVWPLVVGILILIAIVTIALRRRS